MHDALAMKSVSLKYPNGYEALRGVSLAVAAGEIVGLLGASGSGKSTILRAVAGLEPISSGEIYIDGVLVESAGGATGAGSPASAGSAEGSAARRVPTHQRGVGMVFQDGQLFPHLNVGRNVAYGLKFQQPAIRGAAAEQRVAELLDLVGLKGYEKRMIHTLSGGQAQRVALARSLAPAPRLLLLDEPLSALDADLRESLSLELREILKRTGTAALYVTHDHAEADRATDRIIRIENAAVA